MSDDEISKPERKAREHYTLDVADKNLKAIRSFSSELLSVLSEVFLTSSKESVGCLQVRCSLTFPINITYGISYLALSAIKMLFFLSIIYRYPSIDSIIRICCIPVFTTQNFIHLMFF